jgi:hypothetical protein
MPFRYLAGKTHEFAEYNWGAADMSRVIDTLHDALNEIKEDPGLVLDPLYMMNIFKEYRDELPPFKEYWELTFKKKQMRIVNCKDGTKVVHFARLLKYLFDPKRLTDKETTKRVLELASEAVVAFIRELLDQKKATWKYLSVSGSEYCWANSTEERKAALIGMTATNDEAESVLGGTTANIQRYGRINLSNAAAISDAKRNKYFARPAKKNGCRGLFHDIDEAIQECIVSIAIKDAPRTRERHIEELEQQATARRMKEEIIKEKGLQKSMEEHIDAQYYHRMWNSDACWKDDPKNVTKELKKIKSESGKMHGVKENLKIRYIGFGWDWCRHAWSKDGRKYTVYELAKHLQWVIKKEKHEDIPTEPPIKMPQRMSLPALGTLTTQVASLDEKYKANESELKAKAIKMRLERESKGEGSMHSQLQPFSRPDIEDLIGKRIDVLCSVELDDNAQALKWCQGKVLSVIADNKVEVEWDPAPDIEGCEESMVGEQVLLPSKWNKDKKDGAWRMDVDIDIEDTMDDESEDESEVEVEFESDDESESDKE